MHKKLQFTLNRMKKQFWKFITHQIILNQSRTINFFCSEKCFLTCKRWIYFHAKKYKLKAGFLLSRDLWLQFVKGANHLYIEKENEIRIPIC